MENLANNRPLPLEGNEFLLKQSFEIAEMFDIETRNKYNVYGSDGQQIMHVAEQQKGLIGYLFRQMRGHRARRFSLHFYDMKKNLLYLAKHPYCWFFQTLEVYDSKDKLLGTLKTRFAFLKSKVDVLDSNGNLLWQMQTKMNIFFHRWQFPFFRDGKQIACIDKNPIKKYYLLQQGYFLTFATSK